MEVVGEKATVTVQVFAGARVEQLVVAEKLGVEVVGVPIWRVCVPVLVRVMVWWVEVGPGTFWKMRALGVRERPGSGEPKPVRGAVRVEAEVRMVSVPVRGPVAVGLRMIWRKQEAVEARVPVQAGPPVERH